MNRDAPAGVPRQTLQTGIVTGIAATLVWISLCLSGCIDVNGGAIELSWAIRTPDGERSTCEDTGIQAVRLCWEPAADPGQSAPAACDPARSESFPCPDGYGSTTFDVPVGRTLAWAQPLCAGGVPAAEATYQVPPPIARQIATGEVASLGAILIVATETAGACPASGCTCSP